jgi:hypothetical protein
MYDVESHAMMVATLGNYAVYFVADQKYGQQFLDFVAYALQLPAEGSATASNVPPVRLGNFDYEASSEDLPDSIRLLPDGRTLLTSVIYQQLTFHGINAFQLDTGRIDGIAVEPDISARARLLVDNRTP